MEVSDRVYRALRGLGLTDYEARAYLALVAHGPMSAGEVSRYASIPFSKVYSVLERLEGRGWVEVRRGRPNVYHARPPSEVLRVERLRRESEFLEYERCVVEELQPIYESGETEERPNIWIIRGEGGVLARVRDVLSRARSELLLALPSIPAGFSSMLVPALLHLKNMGIQVRLLATREAQRQLGGILGAVDVRVRDEMFGGGVIVDGREAVLILGGGGVENPLAIWSDHAGLAQVARVYFEYLWGSSRPVSE